MCITADGNTFPSCCGAVTSAPQKALDAEDVMFFETLRSNRERQEAERAKKESEELLQFKQSQVQVALEKSRPHLSMKKEKHNAPGNALAIESPSTMLIVFT